MNVGNTVTPVIMFFSVTEFYPGFNVFILCFLFLPPSVVPSTSLNHVTVDEVQKDFKLPPHTRGALVLKGGILSFV